MTALPTDRLREADLNDLLARVRRCTGPDRELDELLYAALRPAATRDELIAYSAGDDEVYWYWMMPREYTGSVDAALALVERVRPQANCYGVEKEPRGWTAYVSRNNVPSGHWMKEADHKTAPLAILSALLTSLGASHDN